MIKVTLDTNCINIRENDTLDQIFDLALNNKIEIFVSDAMIFDILTGKEDIINLPQKEQIPALKRLNKVKQYQMINSGFKFLFPYNKFPMIFNNTELFNEIQKLLPQSVDEEDIRHLVSHKTNKNHVFISNNKKHFIDNGIREQLEKIGFIIKSPSEFLDWVQEKIS